MASDLLEPIKYGDLVCLGSQVTLDQTSDVGLQSARAHHLTGHLCADGLVSKRCTFRLEDPLNVSAEVRSEAAKQTNALPRDVLESVFEIMPMFRYIAAKELRRMEKMMHGSNDMADDTPREEMDGEDEYVVYVEAYQDTYMAASLRTVRGELLNVLKRTYGTNYVIAATDTGANDNLMIKITQDVGGGGKEGGQAAKKPVVDGRVGFAMNDAKNVAKTVANFIRVKSDLSKVIGWGCNEPKFFSTADLNKGRENFEYLRHLGKNREAILGRRIVSRDMLEKMAKESADQEWFARRLMKRFEENHASPLFYVQEGEFLVSFCEVLEKDRGRAKIRKMEQREEQINRLRERARLEQGRNKALYDSALGTELKYGNNVALRHVRSGKFVDVQSKKYSSDKSSGRLVALDSSAFGKPSSQFLVAACLKYFSDGEVVTDQSPIMLENVAISDFYLEASANMTSLNPRYREVTCARSTTKDPAKLENASWIIKLYRRGEDHRSPYLQTGSLVRIANPAVGSFVVASRHKEVTVTEQNDNPDSDDEGDGNDDGGGSVHSKSTSKSNGSMSVGKTSLKALARISDFLQRMKARPPSQNANEENRMSRYIYTLEKNRLKFHATFDGQTDGGQPKATSNSLWILEEQHGPIRSDLVSNSTQYRLRNFVTSQYLAVEYEAVLSSTGSSEKAPSMSKGTADGDYSLQLVDLRTTSKGINSGKHGCLWTLEPVKSKQGAGNFAGDHASFRLGMVAPTGTRDQMLEYLARTHDPDAAGNIAPLPTSKESDEEGVSSDAGSRQSSEGGQAFGQNQNLASESPRRESLMQTGMQQSVRGIQEAIPEKKLYLTSDPATSTLRVQEKDKPFSLSQDCFTVDRVSDPYQRNVRMVTKLVTGLAYFVERVMVSFFKDDLDAAWNLRGGEEKYQDRFFDLGAETQKRNARDRHYFTDEYKKLEEFQIRLLETKMLHRHQDMFTPDADTDTIDALPEEPSPHGSGSRKPSFSFSRHSGGVHSQRKEASESADDIYHVEPKEQCIPETQDKAHQVRREREQKIVHLAEDVVARLANMILFCNADDDYGGYESHEWEKAWRHALDEVFPASAIKERQELLKQSGVIDHLYRVLASTNAKLEELKSRQAAADKKQQSMFNTHGKDVKEGAEAKADREMRANLTLRLETICRVVFKFARHFACRSRENELLLAEGGWIDDLIVMQLGSILGEEECFTDIVSNNEILLDKHISPKTISQCVEIIKEKGLAAGNFLKFLRAVASCEGKPIISNQRDILKMVYSIPTERDKVPLRMDIEKPGGGGGGGHPRPDQDKDKKQEKEKEKQRVLLKTRCRQWKIPGTEEGAKRKQWMSLTKQREAYMRSKQEDRTFEFEGKTDKEGNGLMDPEDGTFRDWLVEVCWSSFPMLNHEKAHSGSGAYSAEVLFTYDYTAELTLIKGAFKGERLLEKDEGYVPGNKNERRDDMENAWRPGGLSTEEVGDRKTVVLTLAHSYEYDWFVAFEELARRYCLMMTILVDVGGSKGDGGGVVSAATAEITEFKLNNEERNVRCTLLCSSAVQDVMSHLMLNKDAKGGRELKYEISANIEVRGVKDKNNLTDMVDGYDSNLQILYQTRDLEKRQAKLKHWGPFFSPRELENVKFWVPLAVLARFLANPITSNKRTHQFLSDAKDGHCRWDGWLQNGALEPEDAELIDPETESPNTIHDTRETNGKNFRRSRIAEYYLQQILLLAELCVGRNNLCIDAIKLEYSFDILMTLFKDEARLKSKIEDYKKAAAGITDAFEDRPVGQTNPECTVNDLDRQYRLGLPYVFRAAFTNLLKVLYIDVSPQMPVVVPSLTRPFPADKEKDIKVALSQFFDGVHPHRYSAPGLQTSSLDLQCPPRIDKLFLVEQVLEDYFEKQDGKQDPFDPPGTRLSMQFLTVLQSMVKFGLYQRKSKIVRLIDPLVDLLDGYRDHVDIPAPLPGYATIEVPPALMGEKPGTINRYKKGSSPCVDTALVMESKKSILRILRMLGNCQMDLEVNIFLNEVQLHWDAEVEKIAGREHGMSFNMHRFRRKSALNNSTVYPADASFLDASMGGTGDVDSLNEDGDSTSFKLLGRGGGLPQKVRLRGLNAADNFFRTVRENNRKLGFDLDGVVEHLLPGVMNVVLFDLIQYDDADLCEAVLSIVMSRSRRTEDLCDMIRRTQLLDRDTFKPDELRRYLGLSSDQGSDTDRERNHTNRIRKHFLKKGLKALDYQRRGVEDPRFEAERSVDQIMAVIADTIGGLETFESEIPGASEEFVEGHFDLLWSLVRDGHNSSSDSDSLKDLFRDAGIFSVFERVLHLHFGHKSLGDDSLQAASSSMNPRHRVDPDLKKAEVAQLVRFHRHARKRVCIIAALQLMECLVSDHEENRVAALPLVSAILGNLRRAIKELHPKKKARSRAASPEMKNEFSRKNSGASSGGANGPRLPILDLPSVRTSISPELPSTDPHQNKRLLLQPLPRSEREQTSDEKELADLRDNFEEAQKIFLMDLLNRLASVLSRIVKGSSRVCERHLGESEISQILNFMEQILEAEEQTEKTSGDALSVVNNLLDVLVEWPSPTPYCQRPVPILRNQNYVLHELMEREGLHSFLMGCSAQHKDLTPRLPKQKSFKAPGGGDRSGLLPTEEIFSIWASDFPAPGSAHSDALKYKQWTLRLRTKLANVLQATCIGANAAAEAQCQKLWKLPDLCEIIAMPSAGLVFKKAEGTPLLSGEYAVRAKGADGPLWVNIGAKRTAVNYLNTVFIDTENKVPDADSHPTLRLALDVLVRMCESFCESFSVAVLDTPDAIPQPVGQEKRSRELRDEFKEWCMRKEPGRGGKTNQTAAREVELRDVKVAAAVETVERNCANDRRNGGRRETLLKKVGKWVLNQSSSKESTSRGGSNRGGDSQRGDTHRGDTHRGDSRGGPPEVLMLQKLEFVCKAAVPLLLNFFAAYPRWDAEGMVLQRRVLQVVMEIMRSHSKASEVDTLIRDMFRGTASHLSANKWNPKWLKEFDRLQEKAHDWTDLQKHSGKETLVGLFKSVSKEYHRFVWPPELLEEQTPDNEGLPPMLAEHLRSLESSQIKNEFDEVVFFVKDPWRCCQVLDRYKDNRTKHSAERFKNFLYNREELPAFPVIRIAGEAAATFQRASRKINAVAKFASAVAAQRGGAKKPFSGEKVVEHITDRVTVTSDGIVCELLTFVMERINNLDEKHIDMLRFVVLLCERMVVLDLENMDRCQREADEDDRIDSQEIMRMLDAERMLTSTQTAISKQGAPEVVKAIICRTDLEALHPETFSFAAMLLERGNIEVQTLFRGVLEKDERFVHAIKGLIHKAIDEARSDLMYIKRKYTRREQASIKDKRNKLSKLLRFIQLLCEGHFTPMQLLFNEQKGSNASINLWLELSKYLNLFKDATRLWRMNPRVMKQLLDTLTEGMQGPCKETQDVLIKANLHEFCGRLLCIRHDDYKNACEVFEFTWANNGELDDLYVKEVDEAVTTEEAAGAKRIVVQSKVLDLVAVQKSAVQTLMSMLEGCSDRKQYSVILDGLDVSTLLSQLGEGMRTARENTADVSNFYASSRFGTGGNQIKERRKQLEEHAKVDVTQDVFTLLTSIDHFTSFLQAELRNSIDDGLEHTVVEYFSPSTGSIEILRGHGVEKVVFRFHQDWKPDQMEKMVKLNTVVETILMITKDGNPQERYPELVGAAIAIHFELHHERIVDKLRVGWGRGWDVGFFLQFAHIRREAIISYSFNIAVILNFMVLFMYIYVPSVEGTKITDAQKWTYVGLSPVDNLVTASGWGELEPLAMILAMCLLPLYALSIIEHACYVVPVNMHRRYLALEITPPFSFLEGQVDLGMKKRTVSNIFHEDAAAERKKKDKAAGEEADLDEDGDTSQFASTRNVPVSAEVPWGERTLLILEGAPFNIFIVVLMLVQVTMSFLDDMVFPVYDATLEKSVTPPEYAEFHEAGVIVEWVALVIFLTDLILRLRLMGTSFFTKREIIRSRLVTEIDIFNTFDFFVVIIWACLFLLQKFDESAILAKNFEEEDLLLQGNTKLSNLVLWLRLLRCVKAIALFSRIVRNVFRPPKVLKSGIRRDSTGIIFVWFLLTDFRLVVLLLYETASALGCYAITNSIIHGTPKFNVVISPFWYCVCLVEMVRILSTLPNVFKAITMRSQQLAHTLILGVFFWYLFGLVAFVFFPLAMTAKQPESCSSLAGCFVVALEWGLRTGDVGEAMVDVVQSDPRRYLQFGYTVIYFLLISTILLNVIFGIIVDAFGELRDSQDELKKKMLNECFICQVERQVFEDPKINTSFVHHVKKQHNIWHYIAFIIAISLKPKTELTGTEQYVVEELKNNRTDWFPAQRSLELVSKSGEEEEAEKDRSGETDA